MVYYKMFGFVKKVFFVPMSFLVANTLKCVSMNNRECRKILAVINNSSNEPLLYPYSVEVIKCSGSCTNINDPYAKLCAYDVSKNINVKVVNLMSSTNETRHMEWHETSKCKCRLDASVCNNKQRWNQL